MAGQSPGRVYLPELTFTLRGPCAPPGIASDRRTDGGCGGAVADGLQTGGTLSEEPAMDPHRKV
jgi:hypothetical protein